jgi:glycosyltransferase involved in cell wall biosynthesis
MPKSWWRAIEGPLVSVIVATRNNAATLERSILSVLDQTYRSLEVIVVDDASDDESVLLLRNMANRDSRIRLIENSRRLGTGESRNVAMRLATGKYVTFHDGDDFSEPDRIALQVEALEGSSDKTLCLCNYVRVNSVGASLEVNERRVMKCIISMMFERQTVLDKVGFFLDRSVSEDADYYERIKFAFGKNSEVVLFRLLYRALYRRNSSFFSQMEVLHDRGGKVLYRVPAAVMAAHDEVKARHGLIRSGELSVRVD